MKPSLVVTILLASVAAAQPVAAVEHVAPPLMPCNEDLYAPDEDALVDCSVEAASIVGQQQGLPPLPSGPLDLNPENGGWCWPIHSKAEVATGSEDKWTPLYGTNSPAMGVGEFIAEQAHTAELDVSFNFRGGSIQASRGETLTSGTSIKAEDGQSRIKYQYLTWTEFKQYKCGGNAHWYDTGGRVLRPTNYAPSGIIEREVGKHEGPSTTTDFDNPMYPSNAGFSQGNTIGVDISYWNKEGSFCPGDTESGWSFGKESVYKVNARIEFNGVFEVGASYVHGESNTFRYTFEGGCYWYDRLGDSEYDVGLAFHLNPYKDANGDCKPEYQRECEAENHQENTSAAVGFCNTRSSPLGYGTTSQLCAPARPMPCEILGSTFRGTLVNVDALQQAWLEEANPTPESKLDLVKMACEGGLPVECTDLCQDPCAEVASLGSGDPCAMVQELVPELCELAPAVCQPRDVVCPPDNDGGDSPACNPEWSVFDACDWDTTSSLQGNVARDAACDGEYPEPRPPCEYVQNTVTCPPVCTGACALLLETVHETVQGACGNTGPAQQFCEGGIQGDPCDTQAPPEGEYAWDVACGRQDFDPCELGNGIEGTYPCNGRLPAGP